MHAVVRRADVVRLAPRPDACIYSQSRAYARIVPARPVPGTDPLACTCGRLRRASRALTQYYDDALATTGLRVTQFSLMRTLAREGTTNMSALAKVALLDRTALSRALDPLVARGYVRVAAGRDMRIREVTLTRAGAAALDQAATEWKRAQAAVAKRIGRERLDTLIDTLADLEALHPDEAAALAAKEPA
jgi:DNA-binding MarR family transcriptional regulator